MKNRIIIILGRIAFVAAMFFLYVLFKHNGQIFLAYSAIAAMIAFCLTKKPFFPPKKKLTDASKKRV